MLVGLGRWTIVAFIVTFSLPASAAYQWQFATGSAVISPSGSCSGTPNSFGNCDTWNSTPTGGPSVNVAAYADTNSGKIDSAYLGLYPGGVGVTNKIENTAPAGSTPTVGAPNHSMDNYGSTDSVLLSFKNAVNLTGVVIGWPTSPSSCTVPGTSTPCDTDIAIWAYTGSVAPLVGQTYASLVAAGWTLVGYYQNLQDGVTQLVNGAASVNTAGVTTAAYWLVSAYTTAAGGSLSTGDDFVKLQSVYGTIPTTKVPEPDSLALLLLALTGAVWLRRGKRKA